MARLSDEELKDLCARLGVTKSGLDLVIRIRSSEPARRVGGGSKNVPSRYPSSKMGFTIQAESHKSELPHVLKMERDNNVLEYYDQPEAIKLVYETVTGKKVGVWHCADFFAIRYDSIGYIECKKEQEMLKLSQAMPNRYCLTEEERWICPPGIRAAGEFGLSYEIQTDKDFTWAEIDNIELLEDYYDPDCPPVSKENVKIIKTILQENKIVSVFDLIRVHGIEADYIYKLIVDGIIFFDMKHARLSEPNQAYVFLDRVYAEAYQFMALQDEFDSIYQIQEISLEPGTEIRWDGKLWKILNAGEKKIVLSPSKGDPTPLATNIFEELVRKGEICSVPSSTDDSVEKLIAEIFEKTSPKGMKEAIRRNDILLPVTSGEKAIKDIIEVPERTLYNWLSNFNAAERELGMGFLGLIPRNNNSGNYLPKMPDAVYKQMEEITDKDFETSKQKNIERSYQKLCLVCEEKGIVPPSKKTFTRFLKSRPKETQIAKRQGSRAAYKHEKFYWLLDRETPVHGNRPFHVVHIDHTEIDLELCSTDDGEVIGRAWLTLMVDAYSRRILAFHLSFMSPSYVSIMMVIRECVRRNQRLPSIIIVDSGPEFNSIYFETLLARFRITKKQRPKSKSKVGSVCERLFGTTNTELLYSLRGNTQLTKQVRLITKSFNPKNLSIWTLPLVTMLLNHFFHEIYYIDDHPALKTSPRNFFDRGITNFGARSHKIIPYSETFRISTLPSTKKGTAKVSPTAGIQINYIHYWHDDFRNPEVSGSSVPVKYDPENAGISYAYVRYRVGDRKVGRWVLCISVYYSIFKGRSVREIIIASEEIRKKDQNVRKNKAITAFRLAMFLDKTERCEEILLQQRKDREIKLAARLLAEPMADGKDDLGIESVVKNEMLIEYKQPEPSFSPSEIVLPDEEDVPDLGDF